MTEIQAERPELRKNYVTFVEDIAQSVAVLAPTASIAALIPLVFGNAGNGTWILFILVLLAFLFVANNISQFATRMTSPGALHAYMEAGIGRTWGLVGGWCYLISMLFAVGELLMGTAHFMMPFIHLVSDKYDLPISYIAILVVAAGTWFVSCRDVRLSTELMLRLEVLSIGLLLLVAIAYLIKSPHGFDIDQFRFTGVSWNGMQLALVLAFFAGCGFESAATLSGEAKDPLKTIPKTFLFSLVPITLLYVFFSYVMVDGFRGSDVPLDKADAPFNIIASASGMPFLGWIVSGCIVISFFSCCVGCLNAAARIIFAMGRNGEFYGKTGDADATHATPINAASFVIILGVVMAFGLMVLGVDIMDGFGYIAQISSFGFITAYLLVSIAAPCFLYKRKELKTKNIIISVVSVLLLCIPLVGSLYPVPPAPTSYLPYVFLGVLLIGFIYSKITAKTKVENPEEAIIS